MSAIRIKIFATQFSILQSFHVSQDNKVPIEMELVDYSIPSNANVVAFVRGRYSSHTYREACTYSGNVIRLVPPTGFFVPGPNLLQVEINETIIPFYLEAICKDRVSTVGNPSTPDPVLPYVERAEQAAESAENLKKEAQSAAKTATDKASDAAESERKAGESAADAQKILESTQELVVRTPYIGDNGHWYIWSLSKETFVDSGAESRGVPPAITGYISEYQVASNGTLIPTGAWIQERPVTPQGQYLWTRITASFSTGNVIWYSVSYRAIDGEQSAASEIGLRVVDGMLCQVFTT